MNSRIYQNIQKLTYKELIDIISKLKQVVYSGDKPPEFYGEWEYYKALVQELDNRDII